MGLARENLTLESQLSNKKHWKAGPFLFVGKLFCILQVDNFLVRGSKEFSWEGERMVNLVL